MDRLREMEIFAAVATTGSLSAAARHQRVSVAMVSKQLAQLERRLGTQLVVRTTRKLTLTEEGRLFLERCRDILAEIADAEQSVSSQDGALSGTIRISAPVAFGRSRLAPLIAAFAARHPQLSFHLQLTDTIVDLLAENIDMAVRFGDLPDSQLVARRLVGSYRIICAAPSYLKMRGRPQGPAELAAHDCIAICYAEGASGRGQVWRFAGPDGQETALRITGRLAANNGEVAHAWALAGLGLAQKSIWDIADDLAAGRLVPVLAEYRREESLHAVFPPGRQIPRRLQVFTDYLTAELRAAERKLPKASVGRR
jgi:DNA-binding transcriptional LysR family regulator